jgi:signal peptidase II
MPVTSRCVVVLAGTALLGIGLDQATKALMIATRAGKPPVRLIGHVLTIEVSRNPGAAFSFAPAATVLFTCMAVLAVLLSLRGIPLLGQVPGQAEQRAL